MWDAPQHDVFVLAVVRARPMGKEQDISLGLMRGWERQRERLVAINRWLELILLGHGANKVAKIAYAVNPRAGLMRSVRCPDRRCLL